MKNKNTLPILSSRNVSDFNKFMLESFGEVWTYAPKELIKPSKDIVEGMDFILEDTGQLMTSILIENPIDEIFNI